jgi:hypothetical protein
MDNKPEPLDYQPPQVRVGRTFGQKVLFSLHVLSIPFMLITGLAALDGGLNSHSDFVFFPWLCFFVLSCTFPILWFTLGRPRMRA